MAYPPFGRCHIKVPTLEHQYVESATIILSIAPFVSWCRVSCVLQSTPHEIPLLPLEFLPISHTFVGPGRVPFCTTTHLSTRKFCSWVPTSFSHSVAYPLEMWTSIDTLWCSHTMVAVPLFGKGEHLESLRSLPSLALLTWFSTIGPWSHDSFLTIL